MQVHRRRAGAGSSKAALAKEQETAAGMRWKPTVRRAEAWAGAHDPRARRTHAVSPNARARVLQPTSGHWALRALRERLEFALRTVPVK